VLTKHFNQRATRSNAVLPHHPLPIRAIKLLVALFGKKQPVDKLAHLREWEREKIIKLGLTVNSSNHNRHHTQQVNFGSWRNEKVTHFDLAESVSDKKSHKNQYVTKKQWPEEMPEKTNNQDVVSTPKQPSSPSRTFKKAQEVDEFFEILGYE
jgi:hypothetical protein